jgi:hypothetical protein
MTYSLTDPLRRARFDGDSDQSMTGRRLSTFWDISPARAIYVCATMIMSGLSMGRRISFSHMMSRKRVKCIGSLVKSIGIRHNCNLLLCDWYGVGGIRLN